MVTIAKKKKKSSGALVLIIFFVCLAGLITAIFMFTMRSPSPDEARAEHASIDLDQLMDEVLSINLETDFPETPDGVMRLYNDTFRLLYGWDRRDTYTLSRVLEIQRSLYSQALYELNPLPQQLSRLIFAREEEARMGIELVGIHQGAPTFHRFSQDRCAIYVIKFISNGQSFHYNYHLFLHPETERWEIGMWDEIT